jgi:undecaprenyl-diphosphatase
MDVLHAVILAIVEGLTEFLPVSSTGHLVLTANLLLLPQTEFQKSFEIFIQLGAILAVVNVYWRKLLKNVSLWTRIITAFIPTAVIGFVLYRYIKDFLLGNTLITVLALGIGGLIIILAEYFYNSKKSKKGRIETIEKISLPKAFLIGLIQAISIIPGTSRSAASILGGMFLGLSRQTAVEFSFYLAIPTIAAASGYDLLKSNFAFSLYEWNLLVIGFTGSFIVAHFVIIIFMKYVKRNTLTAFGIYRIILAVVYLYLFIR